jgi:hypothetical protein
MRFVLRRVRLDLEGVWNILMFMALPLMESKPISLAGKPVGQYDTAA